MAPNLEWRMSFYPFEKEILKDLGNMNPVIKIMKVYIEERFQMLNRLVDCLKKEKIDFFWDQRSNLIANLKSEISNRHGEVEKIQTKLKKALVLSDKEERTKEFEKIFKPPCFVSHLCLDALEETEKLSGLAALNRHPSVRRVTPQRVVHRTLKYVNLTESKTDCLGAGCPYHTWQSSRPLRRSSLAIALVMLYNGDYSMHMKKTQWNLKQQTRGASGEIDVYLQTCTWRKDGDSGDEECYNPDCLTTLLEAEAENNQFWQSTGRHTSRRLLRAIPRQITTILQADALWSMGITGRL
ncbi:hypothetical protein ANN_10514 [Periplaneta americana]|uniref:Uncharacterized protein n=1 Tax=Periplaneta americana TaxID=6978 RepID=A0ABQ8TP77_PERAM|nr:hypothetical protein ANN_10514 [Periplaneta americana]